MCPNVPLLFDFSENRYAALLSIGSIRIEVLKKMIGMLLHSLPRVIDVNHGLILGENCSSRRIIREPAGRRGENSCGDGVV